MKKNHEEDTAQADKALVMGSAGLDEMPLFEEVLASVEPGWPVCSELAQEEKRELNAIIDGHTRTAWRNHKGPPDHFVVGKAVNTALDAHVEEHFNGRPYLADEARKYGRKLISQRQSLIRNAALFKLVRNSMAEFAKVYN